jgi:DNA-binding MarR family transcriptional regulator
MQMRGGEAGMDLLQELGAFALASRLRRLADRLKSDATTLYHNQGVDFSDNWFLVGYLLSRYESMNVTEMAKMLAISRPAISQIASEMARRNLITIRVDERDRRRRLLALTDKGKETVAALERVWEVVGACTEEMIESTGQDILKALSAIEESLEKRCMFSRVINKLSDQDHEQVS